MDHETSADLAQNLSATIELSNVDGIYNEVHSYLEGVLDTLAEDNEHLFDVSESVRSNIIELENWLENAVASLESWSVDIRIKQGALDSLQPDSALACTVRDALFDIKMFAKKAFAQTMDHEDPELHEGMEMSLELLKSLIMPIRMHLAMEKGTGPLQPLNETIDAIKQSWVARENSRVSQPSVEGTRTSDDGNLQRTKALSPPTYSSQPPDIIPSDRQDSKLDVHARKDFFKDAIRRFKDTMETDPASVPGVIEHQKMEDSASESGSESSIPETFNPTVASTEPTTLSGGDMASVAGKSTRISGFTRIADSQPIVVRKTSGPRDAVNMARRVPERLTPYGTTTIDLGSLASIFPRQIKCLLTVAFNEIQKFDGPLTLENFVWHDEQAYVRLSRVIQKIKVVFEEGKIVEDASKMYLRYATCFVKGNENESNQDLKDSMLIDDEKVLTDRAIQQICGFIHDYPYQKFDLFIRCDYSSTKQILPSDDQFHLKLRREYMDKMLIGRQTIRGQRYISIPDLNRLINDEYTYRLIDEDFASEPKLTDEEKKRLEHEVLTRPAHTLQAVCCYKLIPMRYLFHILCEDPHAADHLTDRFDSLKLDTRRTCKNSLCDDYYDEYVSGVYSFYPVTIRPDAEHTVLPDNAVVPISYTGEGTELGSGPFSTVYEVEIDPLYHMLSSNIFKTYALKAFRPNKASASGFDREIQMILYFARYLSHDHISTHITSWTQNEIYYMLYEKAHGNLRSHFRRFRTVDHSQDRLIWFFTQLRGLSDAIRKMHHFRDPDSIDPDSGERNTMRTRVVGYHHDIKPENILTFDLPYERPTFKLSDFGYSKFSAVRTFSASSYHVSELLLTQTYLGPECQEALGRRMTRPLDMWALGCVFLEMTLWFLGIEHPDGKQTFVDMRVHTSSKEKYDYFWQRNSFGFFELNEAVVIVLEQLKTEICRDMTAFQELITLLRMLLEILPENRPNALQLFDGLDVILIELQVELGDNPGLYIQLYDRNMSRKSTFTDYVLRPSMPVPRSGTGEVFSRASESRDYYTELFSQGGRN